MLHLLILFPSFEPSSNNWLVGGFYYNFVVLWKMGGDEMELYKKARLEGESEGFDGETIFELDNGQKWQQVEYYYRYRYKYRPTVKIYKDGMRYYLELENIDRKVRVERIE